MPKEARTKINTGNRLQFTDSSQVRTFIRKKAKQANISESRMIKELVHLGLEKQFAVKIELGKVLKAD